MRHVGHDVETRGAEQHPGEDLAEERRGAQRAREHALEEEHGEHEREHAGLRGERDHGSRCRRVHLHGLGPHIKNDLSLFLPIFPQSF